MLIPVQTIVEQEGVGVLSSRDEKGHTPAHWACLGGHTTILRFIIENKVHTLSLVFHFHWLLSAELVVYGCGLVTVLLMAHSTAHLNAYHSAGGSASF